MNEVLNVHMATFQFEDSPEPILKNLNISVRPGEKLSIVGPGGSGKSSLLKIFLGLLKPQTGSVSLLDTDMIYSGDQEKLRMLRSVGMAFQQGALFDFMTVRENLEFSMLQAKRDQEEVDSRIDILLETIQLPHTRDMFPHELSGGMQRRIGIARAVAAYPQVVFFDEPTSGLDPVTSSVILNMIQKITSEDPNEADTQKRTAVMASSAIDMAMRFADRMIILKDQEIIADQSWRKLIIGDDEWIRHFLSARLVGVDRSYVEKLGVPDEFLREYFS